MTSQPEFSRWAWQNFRWNEMRCNIFGRTQVFITARKWSLGQGNIFRSMCQEFCSQGGAWSRGVSGPRRGGRCLHSGGGGVPGPGGYLVPGVPGPRGCLLQGGLVLVGNAWSWRGCLVWRGCGDPPKMATAAGSMHPTGIHSCFFIHSFIDIFDHLLSTQYLIDILY